MKVQDILTDKSKWTQHTYARDKYGNRVATGDEKATCWCLAGAIAKATGLDIVEAEDASPQAIAIREKLSFQNPDIHYYQGWNDDPERTFAEVRALIEELDI